MRVLIVTSVEAEADAARSAGAAGVVVAGIGRTNAAAATTEALLGGDRFDAVINAGVAGALPGSGLRIGEPVVAGACAYMEEGLLTPQGFRDASALGGLGDFCGNVVPVDGRLLARLRGLGHSGIIATVATCSGTDDLASEVVRRTGAIAEAMEGAAVVHAARRLAVPAIELRVISNTTGRRDRQIWDLGKALHALREALPRAVEALRA
jgi:futalosine hydrolase